jgi:hypothetical protein
MKINFRTVSSVEPRTKSCVSSVVPREGETIELPALDGEKPCTASYQVDRVVWGLNEFFESTDDLQATVFLIFLGFGWTD